MKSFLSVLFIFIFTVGCSSSKDDSYKRPEKVVERAFITTKYPHFIINNFSVKQNRKNEIAVGRNIVTFNGFVLLQVPKEPMIEISPEKAVGVALATCLSVLPLCPLNLLLINSVIGKTKEIEKKCSGRLEFYARKNEIYAVTIEKTSKIEPNIKVTFKSSGATVAETRTNCNSIN